MTCTLITVYLSSTHTRRNIELYTLASVHAYTHAHTPALRLHGLLLPRPALMRSLGRRKNTEIIPGSYH